MLARHAESLFWAGRYIERAESTARLLDVTYHSDLESMIIDDPSSWTDLLAILKLDHAFAGSGRDTSSEQVSEFLVFDPANPGTIRSNVEAARENLRSVRELISTELWEAVNAFHLRLSARDLRDDVSGEPHELYAMIRSQCQALAGVANETMPRDEGWNFLSLGWMLERSVMTLRLLLVRYSQLVAAGNVDGFHHWVSTLKSASGAEAFRRRYRASMDSADVVAFLLMSPHFPRSVLFGLQTAEKSLGWIEGTTAPQSRPQRLIGRLRADVEYLDVAELLAGDLSAYLETIENDIRQVSEAIEIHYFRSSDETMLHVLDPTMVRG